jgi:hypothetical protein
LFTKGGGLSRFARDENRKPLKQEDHLATTDRKIHNQEKNRKERIEAMRNIIIINSGTEIVSGSNQQLTIIDIKSHSTLYLLFFLSETNVFHSPL